jgi:hypothetical protein
MLAITAIWFSAALMATEIETVKSEPNLEKRSEKALDYADDTMDKVRGLYREGKWKEVEAALAEIRSAVDLARTSLTESGKNPRKNPKYFKKAELKTRELARRLESFSQEVSFDERALVERLREHVVKVHDQFLEDVMTRK